MLRVALITTDGRLLIGRQNSDVPSFGTAPEALLQGFAGLGEAEIHVISCAQKPMRSLEKLADNIFYHSLTVPKIGWLRTGYQGCIRAVRKKLREIQPDIVHGQGTERDCALSAVFSGFPNVLTIHGNMRMIAQLNGARPFSYEWLAARLESLTIPRSNGVVCITRYTRNAVGGLAKKSWVVPNAVNSRFFDLQAAPARNEPPTGLCIGAVCARKNQNQFIGALDPLAAVKKFKMIFLGRAERKSGYAGEFFRLLKDRSWCEYPGFAGDFDKLKVYFQMASFLALPSLEDNCPMVVLEAMAAGVPVIAAKVGGVPDLIEDGKTGLLCDPLDGASLRNAVAQLLNEPDLGRHLAAEAKKQARERFHPTVIARRHLEIYREVLGRTR